MLGPMIEIILIAILSVAVVVLSILVFAGRRKRKETVQSSKAKIKNLKKNRIPEINNPKTVQVSSVSTAGFIKYLKFKNCRQLIPELLKELKKDCRLSKLGFYLKTESINEPVMSVKWNIMDNTDGVLRESHDQIIDRLESNGFVELKDISESSAPLENSLRHLKNNGINYLISIPWVDRKRAVLALSGGGNVKDVVERIEQFQKKALPLVENVRRFEKAEELSYTDSLTGIYNLRYFKKRIREEFYRAQRYEHFLALMIFDIDGLKTFNDKYGHIVGDTLINSFVTVLTASVRSNDIICRYGGDEFCLIMPEIDRNNARLFMERIRNGIAGRDVEIKGSRESLKLTVSIGGAVYPVDSDSIDGLIHSADMALLKAKREGRNCSKLYRVEYDINT